MCLYVGLIVTRDSVARSEDTIRCLLEIYVPIKQMGSIYLVYLRKRVPSCLGAERGSPH